MKQRSQHFPKQAALLLLAVWVGVVGLEVGHQLGHVLAGCNHHHHHGEHADHHPECQDWGGPHEEDQWIGHEHMCELCDWMFSPLADLTPALQKASAYPFVLAQATGRPDLGHVARIWMNSSGRRGPPRLC